MERSRLDLRALRCQYAMPQWGVVKQVCQESRNSRPGVSELVVGQEADAQSARAHAQTVLRVRSTVTGLAILPAALAVVLVAGELTGSTGEGWGTAALVVSCVAAVVLVAAVCVGAVIVRARPAVAPTVEIEERSAPDLYNLVRDLADRLDVPAPSVVALTPDCDSWLEDPTHRVGGRGESAAQVLVIGSPFLWWMRVAELRALLAPVVAGTGPSAQPDIAAARRFVRGLDAAIGVAGQPRTGLAAAAAPVLRFVGGCARLMLRAVAPYAAEMERGVAVSSSRAARTVDQGLRTVAQEQVGLAYAGWDRMLTRVALPAWRVGRWPSRLNAGVVSALTDLSRRDSLAEGFASRLGERPACDLIEEPGGTDAEVSFLAARLFHTGSGEPGPDWAPLDWEEYPEEVVDRIWRTEAARLFRVLDRADAGGSSEVREQQAGADGEETDERTASGGGAGALRGPTLSRIMDRLTSGSDEREALAAGVAAATRREDALGGAGVFIPGTGDRPAGPMGMPLQPHRSGEELLTEHITAVVCSAAVDTVGAAPGLDWLDGPVLLVGGVRRTDLAGPVLELVEAGDAQQLRDWLAAVGVRPDKPVRLV